MDQEIFNADCHAIFRKSSPFLLEYNKLVRRLRESGIIFRIIEHVRFSCFSKSYWGFLSIFLKISNVKWDRERSLTKP